MWGMIFRWDIQTDFERYEKEVLVLPEGLDGPADGRMEERGAY